MIVDCAVYDKGERRPGNLDVNDAFEAIENDDSFVWIGLYEPTEAEFEQAATEFSLHPLAVEDAIHAHQRPKLELYGDVLFLVIKTAHYDDSREAVNFAEIQVFAGARFVITVRHGSACELASVRHKLEEDPARLAQGPVAVVHAILDRIVDDYSPVVDGLDNDIAEIETTVFSDSRANPAGRIYKLKRQVLSMYRAVEPLIEPLEQLHTEHHPLAGTDLEHYFRDVYDHLRRVAGRIEVQRDLLSDVLQVNLAHVTVQQNDDMRRISGWVAIAAIPTMLAGIWGMNFRHMPELGQTWGYPMALGLMAVLCFVLFRYLRHRHWI